MDSLNKKTEMCILADFYGNLLTKKQREMFELYWEKDFSLFEIAEEFNVSRQAVHDCLNKTEAILVDIENKCGFVEKHKKTIVALEHVTENLNLSNETKTCLSKRITTIIDQL